MKNNKSRWYVGIDIGGTKIHGALISSTGAIVARQRCSTPRKAKPKHIVKTIVALIDDLLSVKKMTMAGIRSVGIAVPGVVHPDSGKIIVTPNMCLTGSDIVTPLRKQLHCPIVLGNDVNLGILGEQWLGAARTVQNAVGIFVGTGIGGGIIHEGSLLYGAHYAGAEIGHMIVKMNGPRCGCGNRGCLEAVSGRRGIEREIRSAVKLGAKTVISKMLDGDLSVIKSKVLRKALEKKDTIAVNVMRSAATYLGYACVSIKHILDPEMIVLGGGIIEACGDFMVPIVEKIIDKDPFLSKYASCKVVTAELGDDAVVVGAVALAKQAP